MIAPLRGQSRREVAACVLACAGHAAVLLLALVLAPDAPTVARAMAAPRDERWFDLELVPLPAGARESVIRRAPAAEPGARGSYSATAAGSPSPRGEVAPGVSAAAETPSSPAPEATAGTAAPPRPGAPDEYGPAESDPVLALPPGAGGLPIWSVPGAVTGPPPPAPAPTAGAPERRVDRDVATQVLQGTLGGMDRDKGLEVSVGGITARTVEDAARRISLPHDCRATFEVRVGASGEVLGVRALSSTAGDASLWDRVARGAAAALATRKLDMRGRARRGAIVVVRLESRYVYPSGSPEPQSSDAGSNKSDYLHTTYAVTIAGEKSLPAGPVEPLDRRSRFSKALPTGVVPIEMKPVLPDR